jgi:hypothetical protein
LASKPDAAGPHDQYPDQHPHLLKLSLAGGADEIELRLAPGAEEGTTTLELQHATTLDSHEIGGQVFGAIFSWVAATTPACSPSTCTCGANCPTTTKSTVFHLDPKMRPVIERGSAAMSALLEVDKEGPEQAALT